MFDQKQYEKCGYLVTGNTMKKCRNSVFVSAETVGKSAAILSFLEQKQW